MLKLFDSLSHPTLTQQWSGKMAFADAGFETLSQSLKANNYLGACAVGLSGRDGYEHAKFIEACQPYPELIPVAGFNPKLSSDIQQEIADLKAMGFKAIKIHPRYSQLAWDAKELQTAFVSAEKLAMPIFICTYYHAQVQDMPSHDPYFALVDLLKLAPKVKVMLMHGGGVEVLKYMELARFNANILLDLSLTICKYAGGSIDLDLKFLFQAFDQRICIGTDHPEYSHEYLRERFVEFADGIPEAKQLNIAHGNVQRFFSL